MSARGKTLLPGHGLRREGKPVLLAGCCGLASGSNDRHPNEYDRIGHGLCDCGATSPCLDSNAARQRWHRQHKIDVGGPEPLGEHGRAFAETLTREARSERVRQVAREVLAEDDADA